jgi:hypothetical protein
VEHYGLFHERLPSQHGAKPTSREWVGLYKNVEDMMPEWVVCVGYLKAFNSGTVEFSAYYMGSFSESMVGLQYFTRTNARHVVPPTAFLGWVSRWALLMHILNSTCSLVN